MVDSEPDGFRTVNYAVRSWRGPTGPKLEQLGWPEIDIVYRPGTRIPERATLHLRTVDRRSLQIDLESLSADPAPSRLRLRERPGMEPRSLDGRVMAPAHHL